MVGGPWGRSRTPVPPPQGRAVSGHPTTRRYLPRRFVLWCRFQTCHTATAKAENEEYVRTIGVLFRPTKISQTSLTPSSRIQRTPNQASRGPVAPQSTHHQQSEPSRPRRAFAALASIACFSAASDRLHDRPEPAIPPCDRPVLGSLHRRRDHRQSNGHGFHEGHRNPSVTVLGDAAR